MNLSEFRWSSLLFRAAPGSHFQHHFEQQFQTRWISRGTRSPNVLQSGFASLLQSFPATAHDKHDVMSKKIQPHWSNVSCLPQGIAPFPQSSYPTLVGLIGICSWRSSYWEHSGRPENSQTAARVAEVHVHPPVQPSL